MVNIADILQDKPHGTKLWSPAFGNVILDKILGDKTYCVQIIDIDNNYYALTEFGQLSEHGNCMLYPDEDMQDWEKFQWKEGDVLVNPFGEHCIFKKWTKTDYTEFLGLHTYECSNYLTTVWTKETDSKAINQYISKIKNTSDRKLNLDTLEINKTQFKEGEILYLESESIYEEDKIQRVVFIRKYETIENIYSYASLFLNSNSLYCCNNALISKREVKYLRLATESEQQQLFSALAKTNKYWNSKTKQIEDLLGKHNFKPFDKVLVRDYYNSHWNLNIFSHYSTNSTFKYACISGHFIQCIPYNSQTAHLLGTTDNLE